ncbi:MAG: TIGR00296 family protein [Aigarchaeota archaeon]|nr:TIGR00296 family protein [Candidatus Pelearchaeum maunauluense]
MSLSDRVGALLVRTAREAIELFLERGEIMDAQNTEDILSEKRGVFVTLNTYPNMMLRGCIGFPYPIMPLMEAVIKAAISAAVNDPRFPPLTRGELDNVVVEVSVLTPPEEIAVSKPSELAKEIVIGRDGLIIESNEGSGLLLPQVAVEEGWDAEEFLTHLCIKAGLRPTYWLEGRATIKRFTAQIFAEKTPKGDVVEVPLGAARC